VNTDYQLIAIDDNATVITALQFGAWVPIHEAVETMLSMAPLAIAVIETKTMRTVWQDRFTASLS
jgi:hypothetical protein